MTISTLCKAVALGLIVALPATSFGGDALTALRGRPLSIEGVWDSKVTLQVCGAGPVIRTFRAVNLFEHHGALVATSEAVPPPSLGQWRWTGGRTFRAQFQFMRLGAGAVFEGMSRVTRAIEMAPDGKSFTSVKGHHHEVHKQKHDQPNRRSLANLLLCASGSHGSLGVKL